MNNRIDNSHKLAVKVYEDCTPLLQIPNKLREKAEAQGYLFFRGLLPTGKIKKVRDGVLSLLDERNLLDISFPVDQAVADSAAVNRLSYESFLGLGVPEELYLKVQKMESFHALAHEQVLLDVFRVLFQEEPFVHPRNIARIMIPHKDIKATPPHQDFIHVQGSSITWTAWFPLGDCPEEMGSLSMLEESYRRGILKVTNHSGGAGGLESILCDLDLDWVQGNFSAGDCVIFHSYTVHRALPSRMENRIRLSCDFRYQPKSEPIDESSLYPHGRKGAITWEEIYEGWANDHLQYYWKSEELNVSEWDESIRWQKEKIC